MLIDINPTALVQIDKIREQCESLKPTVVISCMAYNHGKYLRDALEGFVKQQTTFPFVVVIHDDASSDNSSEIIREYARRYPQIILPIYEQENQYSKHDGSLRRIMWTAREVTGASYIALCEGDDYWTHPLKLQRQVDFLEHHPEYSMCFHNAVVHHEGREDKDHLFADLETREYQSRENIEEWIVPTASMVIRKTVYESELYEEYINSTKLIVGDYPLVQTCCKEGKIFGFKEPMSVYRLQPTGWTQTVARDSGTLLKAIYQELEYRRIFGGYHEVYTPKAIARHSRGGVSLLAKGKVREAFKIWRLAFKHAPGQMVKANLKFALGMVAKKLFTKG